MLKWFTSRRTTIFLSLLIFVVAVSLFYVKYFVVTLDDHISKTRNNIVTLKDDIHVARAELKVLTSADRIKQLTEKHTKYVPMNSQQVYKYTPESLFENKNIKQFVDSLQ